MSLSCRMWMISKMTTPPSSFRIIRDGLDYCSFIIGLYHSLLLLCKIIRSSNNEPFFAKGVTFISSLIKQFFEKASYIFYSELCFKPSVPAIKKWTKTNFVLDRCSSILKLQLLLAILLPTHFLTVSK